VKPCAAFARSLNDEATLLRPSSISFADAMTDQVVDERGVNGFLLVKRVGIE
jgi:hypothetical protein